MQADVRREVLEAYHEPGSTYATVAARFGRSRGWVHRILLSSGELKHQERRAERDQARLDAILNTVIDMDAMAFLSTRVPPDSVDAVISSPPYNIHRPYGGHGRNDAMPWGVYRGWLRIIACLCARVLKPGGTIILQVGTTKDNLGCRRRIDTLLEADLRDEQLVYQNTIASLAQHGLTPSRRLAERWEAALVFSKGEAAVFNPDAIATPQKQPEKRAYKGANKGELSGRPLGAWPSDVWFVEHVKANHPEHDGGHPAPFSRDFARRAILGYTNADQLVLDPFMGSGTVGVVCKETGRRFIGCDLWYAEQARERIARAVPDLFTALPGVTERSLALRAASPQLELAS